MYYKKVAESYILRLEIGEELCACLLELAQKEDIRLAEISGLGAAASAQVGIFDIETKTYCPVRSNEFLEAVSLTGNLTRKDGEPYLHMHALLANPASGKVLAGHLNELTVGATAEVFVRSLPGEICRFVDSETGLNLMDMS